MHFWIVTIPQPNTIATDLLLFTLAVAISSKIGIQKDTLPIALIDVAVVLTGHGLSWHSLL